MNSFSSKSSSFYLSNFNASVINILQVADQVATSVDSCFRDDYVEMAFIAVLSLVVPLGLNHKSHCFWQLFVAT